MTSTPAPPSSGTSAELLTSEFLNRELSWLEFNRRVLHEALDSRTPLLERIGFLAIFNSNLDEFYMKRVGGLKRQLQAGVVNRTPDGMTTQEQLDAIRDMVIPMLQQQADCYRNDIKPALAEQGIHLLRWNDLSDNERAEAEAFFESDVFPVVTPLAVDPGHPFPFISNLSTSLGVMLQHPAGDRRKDLPPQDGDIEDVSGRMHFARVKVPGVLPQWVPLSGGEGQRFINLQDIIRYNLDELFEGMIIKHVEPFRITRNADIERDEEDAEDLLELVEQELRDRRFAKAVRLETDDEPFHPMNHFLRQEMNLEEDDLYTMPALLDYTDLWEVHGQVGRPDLKYEPAPPVVPARLADSDASIFSVIRNGDLLVHHPYESFSASVERFIRAAATDPDVIAIKLTLYRTAKDSPFIPDLIKAAESGKQVVVLVELKARFDEERNVQLAQKLEKAGIHVVYGVVGYKTHTKTSLVVRREGGRVRTYAHIGTGNYNSKTANLYTDLGLFTMDPRITSDLVELFHFLTGRSVKRDFKHLLIAPTNMRSRFEQMIDREIQHAKAWVAAGNDPDMPDSERDAKGGPLIIAKMNSLEDKDMCRKLYEANNAGVRVKLIVRGFCCLRPGIEGLSDRITVQSVIGRFLEHSRIYYFRNQAEYPYAGEYYIGSADWMYRNLNNRVECITPIYEPTLKTKLQTILETMLADHRQAWDMHADGSYTQRTPPDPKDQDVDPAGPAVVGTHQHLMDLTRLELADG
jgi:polyphosphate kinase